MRTTHTARSTIQFVLNKTFIRISQWQWRIWKHYVWYDNRYLVRTVPPIVGNYNQYKTGVIYKHVFYIHPNPGDLSHGKWSYLTYSDAKGLRPLFYTHWLYIMCMLRWGGELKIPSFLNESPLNMTLHENSFLVIYHRNLFYLCTFTRFVVLNIAVTTHVLSNELDCLCEITLPWTS